MSEDFLHKVSIPSINVTQLPMLTIPRSPEGA